MKYTHEDGGEQELPEHPQRQKGTTKEIGYGPLAMFKLSDDEKRWEGKKSFTLPECFPKRKNIEGFGFGDMMFYEVTKNGKNKVVAFSPGTALDSTLPGAETMPYQPFKIAPQNEADEQERRDTALSGDLSKRPLRNQPVKIVVQNGAITDRTRYVVEGVYQRQNNSRQYLPEFPDIVRHEEAKRGKYGVQVLSTQTGSWETGKNLTIHQCLPKRVNIGGSVDAICYVEMLGEDVVACSRGTAVEKIAEKLSVSEMSDAPFRLNINNGQVRDAKLLVGGYAPRRLEEEGLQRRRGAIPATPILSMASSVPDSQPSVASPANPQQVLPRYTGTPWAYDPGQDMTASASGAGGSDDTRMSGFDDPIEGTTFQSPATELRSLGFDERARLEGPSYGQRQAVSGYGSNVELDDTLRQQRSPSSVGPAAGHVLLPGPSPIDTPETQRAAGAALTTHTKRTREREQGQEEHGRRGKGDRRR